MKNKKAFTLIELVSVLVILAILALIVTPLVLNIIKKARTAADKRSIDAYGRSIELAIADYLLENGTFPTSINDLTIEYSGDRVVCSTTQLNSDSSVYLAGCTVNNREVKDYTYGTDKSPSYEAYSVGDEVTYNNVDYYVIKNSGIKESTVTLLKAEPLSVAEVNEYGVGHINKNTDRSQGTAHNQNGYGGIVYYSSETCAGNSSGPSVTTGCTNDYTQSDIKYVVDAWKTSKSPLASEVRLITLDDLEVLGYEWKQTCPTCDEGWVKTANVPSWVYNSNYWYWTMTSENDSLNDLFIVRYDGQITFGSVLTYDSYTFYVVRPVIVIEKSVLTN